MENIRDEIDLVGKARPALMPMRQPIRAECFAVLSEYFFSAPELFALRFQPCKGNVFVIFISRILAASAPGVRVPAAPPPSRPLGPCTRGVRSTDRTLKLKTASSAIACAATIKNVSPCVTSGTSNALTLWPSVWLVAITAPLPVVNLSFQQQLIAGRCHRPLPAR